MHIAFLYTESALTPWKENVNEETLLLLVNQSPINIRPAIVEFEGFNDSLLHRLRQFDLVFNLCYGFKNAGQVEVAAWLTENNIVHTASSPTSMRMAQDKGILPAICKELGLLTPPVLNTPEDLCPDKLYLRKPRFGSCHRLIDIGTGTFITTHFSVGHSDFLVQPYISGREFSVAVIPDHTGRYFESLPPVEIYPEENCEIFTAGSAFGKTKRSFQPDIPESLWHGLGDAALALHNRMQLNGMSRTDFRVNYEGDTYVLDVNALPNLDPVRSLLPAICESAGISISDLIRRIINNTLQNSRRAGVVTFAVEASSAQTG